MCDCIILAIARCLTGAASLWVEGPSGAIAVTYSQHPSYGAAPKLYGIALCVTAALVEPRHRLKGSTTTPPPLPAIGEAAVTGRPELIRYCTRGECDRNPTIVGALGNAGRVTSSVASQGVALLPNIYEQFDFKRVAIASIAGRFGDVIKSSGFVAGGAGGVIGNALTQGVSVAIGLQASFDWTGVAAGGIVGGVTPNSKLPSDRQQVFCEVGATALVCLPAEKAAGIHTALCDPTVRGEAAAVVLSFIERVRPKSVKRCLRGPWLTAAALA